MLIKAATQCWPTRIYRVKLEVVESVIQLFICKKARDERRFIMYSQARNLCHITFLQEVPSEPSVAPLLCMIVELRAAKRRREKREEIFEKLLPIERL